MPWYRSIQNWSYSIQWFASNPDFKVRQIVIRSQKSWNFQSSHYSVQSNLNYYKLITKRLQTRTNRSSGYYKHYPFWTLLDSNVWSENVFDIKQCGWTDLELAVESLLFCKPLRRYRWIRNWIYPNLFDHRNCPNFRFQSFASFFPPQIYQLYRSPQKVIAECGRPIADDQKAADLM